LKIFLQRKRNTELEIQKMSDKFVELTNKLKEAYEENNRIVNEINSKINPSSTYIQILLFIFMLLLLAPRFQALAVFHFQYQLKW